MATTQVPIGLNKQDAGDVDWHAALNAGIDACNSRLTLVSGAGTFDPNGVEIGRWQGQRYFEAVSAAWWVFAGTVGTNTGWVREIPRGVICMWSGTSPPAGWVICDGQLHVPTGYTPPNLQGRFIVGRDPGQTEFDVIAETGGAKTVTLSVNEMPSHDHGGATGANASNLAFQTSNLNTGGNTGSAGNAGTHTHPISAQGGGQPHQNLPPYYVLAYIAKL